MEGVVDKLSQKLKEAYDLTGEGVVSIDIKDIRLLVNEVLPKYKVMEEEREEYLSTSIKNKQMTYDIQRLNKTISGLNLIIQNIIYSMVEFESVNVFSEALTMVARELETRDEVKD